MQTPPKPMRERNKPVTLAEIELQRMRSQQLTIKGVARYTIRGVDGKPTTLGAPKMIELVTRLCEYEETNDLPEDVEHRKIFMRNLLATVCGHAVPLKNKPGRYGIVITEDMLKLFKEELSKYPPLKKKEEKPNAGK